MRCVRLLALVVVALAALGVAASAASAADGTPAILCLVAECNGLEIPLKGGNSKLEGLKGEKSTFEAISVEAKVKGCDELTGNKDISSCKDIQVDYSGFHEVGSEAKCSTSGDTAGVVLMLWDLRMAAEEELKTGILRPLLLAKVLNKKLEAGVVITCGVRKIEVKGTLGCLLAPGLTNLAANGEVSLECRISSGDPATGLCVLVCEELEKDPFLLNAGGGNEDAWMEFSGEHALKGKVSKDVFLDD